MDNFKECYICGFAHQEKGIRCKKCNNIQKNFAKRKYKKLKKLEICVCCKKNKTKNGVICEDCKISKKEDWKIYKKRLLKQKKENHKCFDCNRDAIGNKTRCEICTLKGTSERVLNDRQQWKNLFEMFNIQQKKCLLTNRPIKIGINAELDHIKPVSRGGGIDLSNFRWVDRNINNIKGNLLDSEFYIFCLNLIENILKGKTIYKKTKNKLIERFEKLKCKIKKTDIKNILKKEEKNKKLDKKCGRCANKLDTNRTLCSICCMKGLSYKLFNTTKRWKELKNLFSKQNKKCAIANIEIEIGKNAEIDHIIPISRGGNNQIKNLRWVCSDANQAKSGLLDKELVEWCLLALEHKYNN